MKLGGIGEGAVRGGVDARYDPNTFYAYMEFSKNK